VRVGRLRLVPLDVAVDALRALTTDGVTDGDEADEPHESQPETADAVLAALGMERAS
jgi:hypothetical protein